MKLSARLAWLWVMALLTLFVGRVPAFAAETMESAEETELAETAEPAQADFDMEEGGFYNIVLLMDKSGSMNFTDPNRNAVNEAKMFVHSLYTGVQNKWEIGANVEMNLGILPFSRDPEPGVRFVKLDSDGAVTELMNAIDAIRYDPVNTGGTDLGKAVSAAVAYLNEREDRSTHSGLIVLFTDGYTDYLSSEPNKEQLERESAELLQSSLAEAQEKQYEIYVIGLNHVDSSGQERIKPQGRAEIMRIANETQVGDGLVERAPEEAGPNGKPKKNYRITNSLRDVQDFYIKLFANLMRSAVPVEVTRSENQLSPSDPYADGAPRTYFDIPIETNRVSCCNVYVTSEGNVGDIRLFDPSGAYVAPDAPDSTVTVKRDSGDKYAIYSLWHPEMGNWRLGVSSPSDAPFRVQYVPISAMKIKTAPLPAKDGKVEIEVRAFYDNEDITEEIAQDLAGALDVVTADRTPMRYYFKDYNSDRNALITEIPVPPPGRYLLYTRLKPSETELKVSQRIWDYTGETTPPTPELTPEPLELSVNQGDDIEINPKDAFSEWDEQVSLTPDSVEWTSGEELPVTINNDSVTADAKDAPVGTVAFVIRATDSLNREWEIPVTLEVKENSKKSPTPGPSPQPEPPTEPLEVSVNQGDDITVNPKDAFSEWDEQVSLTPDSVEWTSGEELPVEINNDSVTVKTEDAPAGTVEFTVHAMDSLNREWDIPVKLDVEKERKGLPLPVIIMIAALGALALLILALLILILGRKARQKRAASQGVQSRTQAPPPPPTVGLSQTGGNAAPPSASSQQKVSLNKNSQNP